MNSGTVPEGTRHSDCRPQEVVAGNDQPEHRDMEVEVQQDGHQEVSVHPQAAGHTGMTAVRMEVAAEGALELEVGGALAVFAAHSLEEKILASSPN